MVRGDVAWVAALVAAAGLGACRQRPALVGDADVPDAGAGVSDAGSEGAPAACGLPAAPSLRDCRSRSVRTLPSLGPLPFYADALAAGPSPGTLLGLTSAGLVLMDGRGETPDRMVAIAAADPFAFAMLARGADGYLAARLSGAPPSVHVWVVSNDLTLRAESSVDLAEPAVEGAATGTPGGYALWLTARTGDGSLGRTQAVVLDLDGQRVEGPTPFGEGTRVWQPAGGPEAPALTYWTESGPGTGALTFLSLAADGPGEGVRVGADAVNPWLRAAVASWGAGAHAVVWLEEQHRPTRITLIRRNAPPCETPPMIPTIEQSYSGVYAAVVWDGHLVIPARAEGNRRTGIAILDAGGIAARVDVGGDYVAGLFPIPGGLLVVTTWVGDSSQWSELHLVECDGIRG